MKCWNIPDISGELSLTEQAFSEKWHLPFTGCGFSCFLRDIALQETMNSSRSDQRSVEGFSADDEEK